MGKRSKIYRDHGHGFLIDHLDKLPQLKEAIIKHVENELIPDSLDGFRAYILSHIDAELQYIKDTKNPIILRYVLQEYHLPDDMEWQFYNAYETSDYLDGLFVDDKEITPELQDKVTSVCNKHKVFLEPIESADFWLRISMDNVLDPIPVSNIPSIAIVMENLSVFGYIVSNWAEVAEQDNTFVSKNGTPIKAQSYRQALTQWHDRERKERATPDDRLNKATRQLRELDRDITKLLKH